MRPIIASLSAALLVLAGCTMDREPVNDIASEAPDNVTVLLSNPYVRVAEFRLAPGEGLPLHTGGPRLVYPLSDYRIRWKEAGEEVEREWSTGDIHWHDALPHEIQNVGTTEARYLVVTRLNEPLPEGGDEVSEDAADVAPRMGKLMFTNDIMRLVHVSIAAGDSIPMYAGRPRVIYALTDYTLSFREEGGEVSAEKAARGEARFHGHAHHAVTNTGETGARFLVFGLKK